MLLQSQVISVCCLFQDHPVVDDVKVTLDYDLDAPLAAPVSDNCCSGLYASNIRETCTACH